MNKKMLLLAVIFLTCFTNSVFAVEAGKSDSMEAAEGFFLPQGDAQAGRDAFVQLKCVTCHTVNGDSSLPAPLSANRGPMLRKWKGDVACGEVMDAIVSPSHRIKGELAEGQLSHMGDFSNVMTVRQLIDITAYLTEPVLDKKKN